MLSEKCEEPQRQTAEEDRVHCHGRARAVREQRLRGFQLPGCSSLVTGCALSMLILLKLAWNLIASRTALGLEEKIESRESVQKEEVEMQGLAEIRVVTISPSKNNTNKPKTYRARCNTTSRTYTGSSVCTHHFARLTRLSSLANQCVKKQSSPLASHHTAP